MAPTVSNNESLSNPISNTNRSPVQGNTMASSTSLGGFEVVTPVLSTAEVLIEIDPKLPNETITDALSENKTDTAKATALKTSAEGETIEEAIEMKESAEGGKTEESITEQAPGTSVERKTIHVNGDRHVESSGESHSNCIIIDGTCYVQEIAPSLHKTAYDLVQSANFPEDEDLSQEETSRASSFNFRGHPIMIHVELQSYSVHASILVKSHVLGSMSLEETGDGSYFLILPDEDPDKFEKLLTYMYQGTWEPEQCANDSTSCWGVSAGGSCNCYNMKTTMQIYGTACKYAVHGLAEKIASKLDLTGSVLGLCDAFKCAYEICPGSDLMRSLFRKNLVTVFENTLRTRMQLATRYSAWGNSNKSGSLASELAELVSCGGNFAVDLMQAFATAQENAIRAKLPVDQQGAGDHDNWGRQTVECGNDWAPANHEGYHETDQNAGDHDNWGCQTVEGGNDWAPANNEGYHETDHDAGGWFSTGRVVNDMRQCVMNPVQAPGRLAIREDVENLQVRLGELEDMVSGLQLIAQKSAQAQQPAFQQPPNGSIPGLIAPGWGPGPSVPAKASWFQADSGGRVVGETNNLSVPLYQPPVTTTDRVHPSLDW